MHPLALAAFASISKRACNIERRKRVGQTDCCIFLLSVRPGHLHIYYYNNDSIIALCGNKDLLCLAFVILICCVADSLLLIMAATKLTTLM